MFTKASIYVFLSLGLVSGVLTHPLETSIPRPQQLTLVFHNADGQYTMRLPADGREHLTSTISSSFAQHPSLSLYCIS